MDSQSAQVDLSQQQLEAGQPFDMSSYQTDLYNPSGIQDWRPDNLFDESLFLPDGVSMLPDKHALLGSDLDAHDSKRQELGENVEKKKPGRKPYTNEPTTKRKAQNRAAQRAFRERKENHVAQLEARVLELEQQNNNQSMENKYLKSQLESLRTGSDASFAHSSAFTFDFPPPQAIRGSSLESSSSPSDKIPSKSDCPSLHSSNTSPLSTIEKDFNAATMPHFARLSSYSESQHSSADSGAQTGSTNPSSDKSSLGQTKTPKQDELPVSAESFLTQNPQWGFSTMDYRDGNDFSTFDVDPPLFDTSIVNLSPEDLDGTSAEYFGFQTENLEPLLMTEEQESGIIPELPHAAGEHVQYFPTDPLGLKAAEYDEQNSQNGCPTVWRKIVTHPKFASFDLEALCDLFAKKNSCKQTTEKFIQEADWDRFDRKLNEFAEESEKGASS